MQDFLRFLAIMYIASFVITVTTMLCEKAKSVIEEFENEDL